MLQFRNNKENQGDLNDHTAADPGSSRSKFMVESANQADHNILLDRSFFELDEAKFKQFVALLDASLTRNEKLHTLLATKAPWD